MSGASNDKRSRLYITWMNMKQRCLNKNCKGYHFYGERGITVCDEWLKFSEFEKWALSSGYNDTLTIERIDVNGNYEPNNCRWATWEEQHNNKRDNHFLEVNGVVKTIQQWSKQTGINHKTIIHRINLGWNSNEILIQKNFREPIVLTCNGISHTISDWSKILGISKNTLRSRLSRNWSVEKTLTTPLIKNDHNSTASAT